MSVLDIYKKPAALDRGAHRALRASPPADMAFAARAQSIPIAAAEFVAVAKEYPIIFARENQRLIPLALTGVEAGENLFVAPDGRWLGRYVPAFIRQYPFILAQVSDQEMAVCVDEASAALGTKEGDALFDEAGDTTPFLGNAIAFLEEFQRALAATTRILAEIEAAGLVHAVDVRFDLPDGQVFTVAGGVVVDEQAVGRLGPDQASALLTCGALNLIHLHWASLSNVTTLLDLKKSRVEKESHA